MRPSERTARSIRRNARLRQGLTKLSAKTIQVTQTTIAHGLSGTPSVVIISPRGVSFVYESQVADGTNVYMTAAGITTCDIYVAL